MKRVLVVDDDLVGIVVLAALLEDEGIDVDVAHSVEAAMARWTSPDAIDAMLLDRHLGRVDAFDLVDGFRSVRPSTPIVLVSGDVVVEERRFDAVFAKGSDPEDLLRALRELHRASLGVD